MKPVLPERSLQARFTREGHLSELLASAYLVRELDAGQMAEVDAHVSTCIPCRRFVDGLRKFDAAAMPRLRAVLAASPAPAPPGQPVEQPVRQRTTAPAGRVARAAARRRLATWSAATGLLAAAGVLLAVRAVEPERLATPRARSRPAAPPAPVAALAGPDQVRTKGAMLRLSVFANDGATTRRVHWGDRVHAGDRLGFRFSARRPGHLLIVGLDARRDSYLCYPQDTGGMAAAVGAGDAVPLDQAIRLDAVAGDERLVGILCDRPFAFAEVRDLLAQVAVPGPQQALPLLLPGCSQHEVRLDKRGGR
jgi:hypothetical protein